MILKSPNNEISKKRSEKISQGIDLLIGTIKSENIKFDSFNKIQDFHHHSKSNNSLGSISIKNSIICDDFKSKQSDNQSLRGSNLEFFIPLALTSENKNVSNDNILTNKKENNLMKSTPKIKNYQSLSPNSDILKQEKKYIRNSLAEEKMVNIIKKIVTSNGVILPDSNSTTFKSNIFKNKINRRKFNLSENIKFENHEYKFMNNDIKSSFEFNSIENSKILFGLDKINEISNINTLKNFKLPKIKNNLMKSPKKLNEKKFDLNLTQKN